MPIYVLLDNSTSMAGDPLEALKQGIRDLISDWKTDPWMLETAYLSIINFGSTSRQIIPLTELLYFPKLNLKAGGKTALGDALRVLMTVIDNEVLREFVNRHCSVIPVILPNCTEIPRFPIFLRGYTWVDFRKKIPDPLDRLIWGITGKVRSKS